MDHAIDIAGMGRRIRWRLAVPTIVFMFLSSLDRVNISFAALQMNADLGFSAAEYGFGAGILFAGFLAGQYPSIFFQQRVGMRAWMGLSAIVWGLCAGAMAFVQTPMQFYVLRVVLGFVEGGLAPGIVFYLSQFATERERATTFALPMIAIPISVVVGGPISGWLLQMTPPLELAAWRWMFIAEAAPTVLLGLAAFFYFPNRPAEAGWLSAAEKTWLANNAATKAGGAPGNDWSVLRNPRVWLSALLWFCLLSGSYGIIFWLPQLVKQLTGFTPLEVGVITALPWLGNVLGIYFNSAHSDRTGERFFHIAVPATVAAVAIAGAAAAGANALGLLLLVVAGTALGAAQGAFWALPTRMFTAATFAVGAVAINIAGSSGGIVMPQAVGLARGIGDGIAGPTALVAGVLLLGAALVMILRRGEGQE